MSRRSRLMSRLSELLEEAIGQIDASPAIEQLERRAAVARRGPRRRGAVLTLLSVVAAVVVVSAVLLVRGGGSDPVRVQSDGGVGSAALPGGLVVVTADGQLELRSSVDGQLIRTLAENADVSSGSSIAVTPDGETVYFNQRTSDATNLVSVPVAGGHVTPFGGLQCCLQHAAVSPDGRWLAFTGVPNRSDAGRDILLHDLQAHDGSSTIYDRRWTSSPATDLDRGISGLTWAPDSHHVAFSLFTGSATDGAPRVLDIDSAQSTLLDSLPTITTPVVSSRYLGATGNMLGV